MISFSGPASFLDVAKNYAALGCYINSVSQFEFEIDLLLFSVRSVHPGLSKKLSRKYPQKISDKVEFLCKCVEMLPEFRKVPMFSDGWLNLSEFHFGATEIFEVRNILAHGAMEVTKKRGGVVQYRLRKVTKAQEGFVIMEYKINSEYLEVLFEKATALLSYVKSLRILLEGGRGWEEFYQMDKVLRENRQTLRENGFNLPPEFDGGRVTMEIAIRKDSEAQDVGAKA